KNLNVNNFLTLKSNLMAVGTNNRTNKTYYQIIGGRFATKTDKDNPNAVKRFSENKNCDVYELMADYISGRIIELGLRKGDYGWEMNMVIQDVDEKYKIQIPTKSGHYSSFANKLKNINLNQDIYLEPYAFDDKEKKKPDGDPKRIVGMTVKQGNEKIPNFYTKDNPIPDIVFPKGGDEEDVKMYYMKEEKFYRSVIERYAGQFATEKEVESEMKKPPVNYSSGREREYPLVNEEGNVVDDD